ncbi:GNAT family N-acetyltransferase [Myxococcota bacterium]|nr:GNAT family N-acetyltransferase [Myxococcota bacterium]
MHIHVIASPGTEWDEFVERTPGGSLGHAAAWSHVIERAYGLESFYLAARGADDSLVGVLPLVRHRGLGGRSQLVSMPYLDTGGPVTRSPEVAKALVDAALEAATVSAKGGLELRNRDAMSGLNSPSSTQRVDLVLSLENDEQTQWKTLRAKVRNQTRKSEKQGVVPVQGNDAALIDQFYEPFLVNMRDLGSPVHGRNFFLEASRAFGSRMRVIVARLGARSVGGLIAIDYAGAVTVPWASTLRSERSRCPNNAIYWEAIRWAIERGVREFDFGRSPIDGGTYRFKKGWGAEERPLHWCSFDPSGTPRHETAASTGGAMQRLSNLWTHLPVGLSARLGPPIRKRLAN